MRHTRQVIAVLVLTIALPIALSPAPATASERAAHAPAGFRSVSFDITSLAVDTRGIHAVYVEGAHHWPVDLPWNVIAQQAALTRNGRITTIGITAIAGLGLLVAWSIGSAVADSRRRPDPSGVSPGSGS